MPHSFYAKSVVPHSLGTSRRWLWVQSYYIYTQSNTIKLVVQVVTEQINSFSYFTLTPHFYQQAEQFNIHELFEEVPDTSLFCLQYMPIAMAMVTKFHCANWKRLSLESAKMLKTVFDVLQLKTHLFDAICNFFVFAPHVNLWQFYCAGEKFYCKWRTTNLLIVLYCFVNTACFAFVLFYTIGIDATANNVETNMLIWALIDETNRDIYAVLLVCTVWRCNLSIGNLIV